eukprot:3614556-Rhodomonas_salina.2
MKSLCRTMLAEVLSSTPTTGSCVGAGTSWCGGSTSRSSSTLQTSLVTRSIMYVKLGDESLSPMRIRCRCSRANGESSCRNTSTHRPTTRLPAAQPASAPSVRASTIVPCIVRERAHRSVHRPVREHGTI